MLCAIDAHLAPLPMSSMVQPTLSPAVVAAMKEALGCSLLGLVLSMGCVLRSIYMSRAYHVTVRYSVYGISVLQAYMYFKDNSRDARHMRIFVRELTGPYERWVLTDTICEGCIPIVRISILGTDPHIYDPLQHSRHRLHGSNSRC